MSRYEFVVLGMLLTKRASTWSHDICTMNFELMGREVRQEAVDRFRAEIEEILALLPASKEG